MQIMLNIFPAQAVDCEGPRTFISHVTVCCHVTVCLCTKVAYCQCDQMQNCDGGCKTIYQINPEFENVDIYVNLSYIQVINYANLSHKHC